jgi:hypothetical protein
MSVTKSTSTFEIAESTNMTEGLVVCVQRQRIRKRSALFCNIWNGGVIDMGNLVESGVLT